MNTFYTNKKGTREEEAGITTTNEKTDVCLHASALSAVGTKSASSNKAAGFTILFAVIIVSIITLLAATIAGIYQREARLRATSRASSVAFYNADSALECAMLHDRKTSAFATSSASGNVNCGGDSVSVSGSGSSYPYEFTFELNDTEDANVCAGVTVRKSLNGGREITRIESRGRDTCNSSDRQAERALRTAY